MICGVICVSNHRVTGLWRQSDLLNGSAGVLAGQYNRPSFARLK